MPPTPIAYSASKVDLYFPCQRGEFFPAGLPDSEASICAEMCRLAYCRTSMSDLAFDQNKLQTVLAGVGFSAPQCFETKGLPKNEGSHCFLTSHPGRKLAILAFRGTDADDPSDVTRDVEFIPEKWEPGGHVFTGFATALSQVRDGLDGARSSIEGKLLLTGHSLGAAMATLLASAWLSDPLAGTTPPSALYTIGSPRVGDPEFVATLSKISNTRFVDCCDGVTRVPLEVMGYEHVGDPQYIDRTGKITSNPGDDFIRADRLNAVEDYFRNYFWKTGNVGARELADHAPINYVSAVMGIRA
jgi:Lipase (class 3)